MEPIINQQNNYTYVAHIPVVMEYTASKPQKEIIKAEAKAVDKNWFKTQFLKYLNLHNKRLGELSNALDKAIASL